MLNMYLEEAGTHIIGTATPKLKINPYIYIRGMSFN